MSGLGFGGQAAFAGVCRRAPCRLKRARSLPWPLPPVLAPAGGSKSQALRLHHDPSPRIGDLQPVLLRGELMEVLDRKVRVHLLLESAQLLDRLFGDPTRLPLSCSSVAQAVDLELLVPSPQHVPRLYPADAGRSLPRDAFLERLLDHLCSAHCPGLSGHWVELHRAATPGRCDRTSTTAYDPDISCALYNPPDVLGLRRFALIHRAGAGFLPTHRNPLQLRGTSAEVYFRAECPLHHCLEPHGGRPGGWPADQPGAPGHDSLRWTC
jgi:hypothetical protein